MKTVIILRACSGAGKSTIADYIHNLTILSRKEATICCADDYFTDEKGNYNWDGAKINAAHVWCQQKFNVALAELVDTIIVSNTNTRESDVNHYHTIAIQHGYKVFVLTVENWHNGKDVHNVPDAAKTKMKEQLKQSIKL